MRHIAILLFLLLLPSAIRAQHPAGQDHRIVMHVASSDSLEHKMVMRNLRNITEASPTSAIEVVCHGPGLDMLLSDRSAVQGKLKEFAAKGVAFLACENTIKERQLDRKLVMAEAGFTPSALLHIIGRQEQGWSYIKAGF